MLPRQVLLAVLAALSVSALPLNINLGAYSPALVVGDGEISFGNAERAGEVMETLASGAAVAGNAQQQNGQAPPPAAEGQQQEAAPAPAEGAPAEGEADPPTPPAPRIRYHALPDIVSRRAEKRDFTSTSTPLKREPSKLIARDINGFREALNYAREAMKNTPKLEIGSENAGVGIVQNAGTNVQANSAANGALPQGQVEKRQDIQPTPEAEAEKSGITLLAIAEI